MKIFSGAQIYDADKYTIAKQQITSDVLMERVAIQIFNWLHTRLQGAQPKIHLFCGIGNNGGDGIAVARHLQEHGYNIAVYVVNYSEKRSDDFLINLERLKERKIWPDFLNEESELPAIGREDIVIDAIFGIGLNRPPHKWVASLIQHINASQSFVLAVDLPSGLFLDRTPEKDAVIFASHVLSFQAPKLIFFLPDTGIYSNQWEILDIGLDYEYLMKAETEYEYIGKPNVLQWYIPREKFAHKGNYGHALLIGGSYGKMGAISLASKAALVVGSGLVSAFVPECGYIPFQSTLPEVMVETDTSKKNISNINFNVTPAAIGIGPGLGLVDETKKSFANFLKANKTPLVLDADALNILAADKTLLNLIPENAILTPHSKELERLIGKWKDDFDKLKKAKSFTKKHKCILVIKGANTIVLYEGKGFVNSTGNPGMATAGSGDVLTGMITGLIAQGYAAIIAAIFGVYLHGKAGDIQVEKTGYQSLIASDIINGIGASYLDLFAVPKEQQQSQENANEQS